MKVIVLTGGVSAERNVALASGRAIANALKLGGHSVQVIDPIYGQKQPDENHIFSDKPVIGKEFPGAEELSSYSNRKVLECINSDIFDNTDIVFLGLHGKFGEDGKIQSLLEMRGVKYTGSGVTSSALAMDKDMSKVIFNHYGIPTPAWFMSRRNGNDTNKLDAGIKKHFGYPAVIKPNDEGSTVGLSIVQPDAEDVQLSLALKLAGEYSEKIMVEEFIEGRELTVGILGNKALPIVEIKPKDGFYDYEHKYTKGRTEYFCPAEIDTNICDELHQKSLLAHKVLGCSVYSRVDFRMNNNGEYYCLEVNTLPGMTELSLVPQAAKAAGMSFNELLEKIIELSLNK